MAEYSDNKRIEILEFQLGRDRQWDQDTLLQSKEYRYL